MLYLIAAHRDNIKAAEVMVWARAIKDPVIRELIEHESASVNDVQYMDFDLYFILASFTDNELKKIVPQCKFGASSETWNSEAIHTWRAR